MHSLNEDNDDYEQNAAVHQSGHWKLEALGVWCQDSLWEQRSTLCEHIEHMLPSEHWHIFKKASTSKILKFLQKSLLV